MATQAMERTPKGVDKVDRYKWAMRNEPGELRYIDKRELLVNTEVYQRIAETEPVLKLARDWNWISCGALSVADRDGQLWVMDGGHRKAGADRRSDVQELPCIVHRVDSIEREARGFLDINTGRKNVSALGKFRASLAAGDATAIFVKAVMDANNLRLASASKEPRDFKSVALAMRLAGNSPASFEIVMKLCGELAAACARPIHERLLGGLHYIHTNVNVEGGVEHPRLRQRIKQTGVDALAESATKAGAYYAKGGARVWADGMMQAINKGLQNRFELA